MSDAQILTFLVENLEYFETNDFVASIMRSIGWSIAKGMTSVIEACKDLYNITFGLIDITRYTGIESFISENAVLVNAVLILSITVLGYMFLFGKEKKYDFVLNLLVFAIVFTSSGYLFATLNSFAVAFKDGIVSGSGNLDGYELVNQNLYDLRYIDAKIGLGNMTAEEEIPRYPSLSETGLKMIKIAETLPDDEEGLTEAAEDILGKYLVYINDAADAPLLDDVYNGVAWTDFGNTYYYRYKFYFGSYFLSAAATIIVFLGLSYKNMRVIWELMTSRVLVALFSADISSKKKTVRLLEAIRDGYYALCFTAVTLKLYFLFLEYITGQDVKGLVKGILLLFVAFCVIDGANILEKITGVDAGLTSMTSRLMGGMHMIQSAVQMGMQMRQMHLLKQNQKNGGAGQGGGQAGGQGGGRGPFPGGGAGGGQSPGSGQTPGSSGGNDPGQSQSGGNDGSQASGDPGGQADTGEPQDSGQTPGGDPADNGTMPESAEGASGSTYDGADQSGDPGSSTDQHFEDMDRELSGGEASESGGGQAGGQGGDGGNTRQMPEPADDGEHKGMFERRQEKADRGDGGSGRMNHSSPKNVTEEKNGGVTYKGGDGGGEKGLFQ